MSHKQRGAHLHYLLQSSLSSLPAGILTEVKCCILGMLLAFLWGLMTLDTFSFPSCALSPFEKVYSYFVYFYIGLSTVLLIWVSHTFLLLTLYQTHYSKVLSLNMYLSFSWIASLVVHTETSGVEEIPSAHLSFACLSFWVCLINKATNKPKQTEIKTTAQTNVSFPMLFFSCFIGSVFTFVTLKSGPFVGSSLIVGCSCYSFSEGGFYILQLLLSGLSLQGFLCKVWNSTCSHD